MPTLYDIRDDILQILQGEELDTVAEVRLDSLSLALEQKIEAVLQYAQECSLKSTMLATEIARLAAKKKTEENRVRWLWDYVLRTLETLQISRISTNTFNATVAQSPPRVVVAEGAVLPDWLQTIKTITEPNKALIKDQWENGAELPLGISVVQGKHLRIS